MQSYFLFIEHQEFYVDGSFGVLCYVSRVQSLHGTNICLHVVVPGLGGYACDMNVYKLSQRHSS